MALHSQGFWTTQVGLICRKGRLWMCQYAVTRLEYRMAGFQSMQDMSGVHLDRLQRPHFAGCRIVGQHFTCDDKTCSKLSSRLDKGSTRCHSGEERTIRPNCREGRVQPGTALSSSDF